MYLGIQKDIRYVGAHCSSAGGMAKAVQRIVDLEGTALQIFTRNQRQWTVKSLEDAEVEDFRRAWHSWGEYPVLAHDSYLINLASPEEGLRHNSVQAFAQELQRCARLGISLLVTHPGSCKSQGREQGLRTYVQALDQAVAAAKGDYPQSAEVRILLETTAGQGTSLGGDFRDLSEIMDGSGFSDRLGVCLDTSHVFAAGYDLRDEQSYTRTLSSLDRAVGLDRLLAVHLNDSKHPLGSRMDRHEHIGYGQLGLEPFRLLLGDPRLARVPMVLETPKNKAGTWDRKNLAVLREMDT
ncbi:MAG: deoxyribonuclease IV [Desulfovermiculus sp.]|nr:deoxyribonuclease IV [Desulfovermiculus sp.]